ncbi:MAG TPA: ROK family protein [Patescibacteria group bacterium]|nr:ROK family protein [Patescibacteria group bacterium]
MYIIFDIGGTYTRFASSLDGATIIDTKIEPTPQNLDEAVLLYKKLVTDLSHGQKIDALAGGVPGPLNPEKTMLVNAPHLRNWINKPLDQRFRRIADCPVFFENDSALAALGEGTKGAGTGYRVVAYIGVGTGVGGARVVNQQIDVSSIGFEPGDMIIDEGNTLESFISGNTIKEKYGKKASEMENETFWRDFEAKLTLGLNNVTVMWSPDIIVLGGGVGQCPQVSVDRIMLSMYRRLTIYPKLPRVLKATLGDHAALLGSLTYLSQKLGK